MVPGLRERGLADRLTLLLGGSGVLPLLDTRRKLKDRLVSDVRRPACQEVPRLPRYPSLLTLYDTVCRGICAQVCGAVRKEGRRSMVDRRPVRSAPGGART